MTAKNATNQYRPPIVAVMGHIDHGKTTLLDKIRSSNIAAREAGGITQHLSACQVSVKTKSGESFSITFIDTPGHAAFCQMRARSARVTDLVVLVISGIDGIMAQTKECIKEIKKSGVPLIVAVTKIDLPDVALEKIKGQLVELELTPEEYGGQIPLISVSGKTGQGIDELLELILLHAQIMELKSNPDGQLEAIVIESKFDKNRGPLASVIVKNGTLHRGDQVFINDQNSKVKALLDSSGKNLSQAIPGTPVEILGFTTTPPVGSLITDHPTKSAQVIENLQSSSVPDTASTPRLPIVLKADVQGTLEALRGSFTSDVELISAGVGPVTDNDVFLADSAHAQIFAFNVPVPKFIRNLANNQKVPVFESKIIYEIIENIQSQVLKLMDPTIEETILGEAKIIAEFVIDKLRIAGIKTSKGELSKGDNIHLKRGEEIIKNTKVDSIKQGKNQEEKAKSGNEYGMTFKPYVDFKLGDVIIAYKV